MMRDNSSPEGERKRVERQGMKGARAMKESSLRLILMLISFALFGTGNARLSAGQVTTVQTPKRAACTAAEYRGFDFWLGDWDTFELNAPT